MTRAKRLRELGFANYDAYLQSAHWLRLREAYRASDLPQRCHCGEAQVDLHHKTYETLGGEVLTDVVPLCRPCHTTVHLLERRGEIGLDLAGLHDPARAERNRTAAAERDQQRADAEASDRAAVEEMPDRERLERVARLAAQRNVDIAGHLRVISMRRNEGRGIAGRLRKLERLVG